MFDNHKIGERIALLRRERGLTGEKLAELLSVSPQAVSKWENGKNLPETALLPALSQVLRVSIDALLFPQELTILSAAYSDGQTHIDVTQPVGKYVNGNRLDIMASAQYIGVPLDTSRVGVLTVKYQVPRGTYYAFSVQNGPLTIDLNSEGLSAKNGFEIVGAYYGNRNGYKSAMVKMKHYDYFNWDEIHVNHETFESCPGADEPEYLALIYLNKEGIHVISCEENGILRYTDDRTSLYLKDTSARVLPGMMALSWENGMDCTWAGAMYAALSYMGEPYTYEQIMGMSGACYRIAFVDVWDWSAVDALVAFDYATPLYGAIGYELIWADRLEKEDRREERQRIIADILCGKPPVAINLRIAPEWGPITGYSDNGKTLYCRTYFDMEYLQSLPENQEYLEADNWPFAIAHFGEKREKPSHMEILDASLRMLIDSFEAPPNRGYFQGGQAYEKWIEGLNNDALWEARSPKSDIDRRLGVNDSTMLNLIDARRCAAAYLHESAPLLDGERALLLSEIAASYDGIAARVEALRNKLNKSKQVENEVLRYNTIDITSSGDLPFRSEQAALLQWALESEREIVAKAKKILG